MKYNSTNNPRQTCGGLNMVSIFILLGISKTEMGEGLRILEAEHSFFGYIFSLPIIFFEEPHSYSHKNNSTTLFR